MAERPFHDAIEEAYRRLEQISQQAQGEQPALAAAFAAALQEVGTSLEELRVAEEELRQQNEELEAAQAAEAEARQRYQELFEEAPDAYLVTDLDGQITAANRAAIALFGLEARFLLGKPLTTYLATDEVAEFRRELSLLKQEGEKTNWEVRLRPRSGPPATVSVAVRATRRREGDFAAPVRWTLRDVTEQKQLEEEVLRARHVESIGTLAGGIAHDFNNYLTALLGDIGAARRRVRGQETAEILERAERTALLASNLSQQLLTFAKGGAPITQPVSTKELIEHSVEFALRGSNLELRLSLDEDLWSAVVDEGQISQVLTNLLRNAKEAMPEGGAVEVSARNAWVGARAPQPLPPGHYIKIIIADNGPGISPEHMARVFDPYFTTKTTGSGLGLAIVHSIVTRHRGRITFRTNATGGTTFEIYLPATPQQQAPAPPPVTLRAGKGKVLLVDDEALIRVVVSSMLKDIGYTVESAASGAEAVACYRQAREAGQPFDAVLMDLIMPGGMSGEEAARAILNFDAAAKVIASSGYSTQATMAEYQQHGFRGIAPKPYTLATLSEALQEVMVL